MNFNDTIDDNADTESLSLPPEHLFSDYVEMAYLTFIILVGLPINLHVLMKLVREKKKNSILNNARNKRTVRTSFSIYHV